MFDHKNRFIIKDYSNNPTFASFLPGISGIMGTPIWCFYVNRGQGISSFGVRDKNHSIMEFHAAQQAYQNTSTVGFRTFMKIDSQYYEPFYNDTTGDEAINRTMLIGTNEIEIEEINTHQGVQTNILYFTLPNEEIGGLVRKVTLKNISGEAYRLDVLDGMPQVIPYGVDLSAMKMMGQTVKAWMQVQNVDKNMPFYSVRASMEDSAVVTEVKGGHFYFSMTEDGTLLPAVVDSEVVFMENTSLTKPIGFIKHTTQELLETEQICQNALPCGFFSSQVVLEPNETYTFYSLIGQVEQKDQLEELCSQGIDGTYFDNKYKEAQALTKEICKVIETQTGSKVFDAYCEQTYLDNVLRGGMPLLLGDKNIYHVYSRKHGDTERDYNFFSMSPEFYSQGNANFRDVNQNRRCDIYFADFVKDYNIKTFYNLIQLDGYNPLGVQGVNYTLEAEEIEKVLENVVDQLGLRDLLSGPFTPGGLLKQIANQHLEIGLPKEMFIKQIMQLAKPHVQAVFGEGYWTDHWTYNLDLVESFLGIYPEQEKTLLFGDVSYTYFESGAVVRPRKKRYVLTDNGVRQYHAVDHHIKSEVKHKEVRVKYGKGAIYTSNLFEKMMILAANKFAALDPYGMGIEMEGGKPGWYDALNGLPGIFGSSMAESYELYRMIEFMLKAQQRYKKGMILPIEVMEFIRGIQVNIRQYQEGQLSDIVYWDKVNDVKEAYREAIIWGIKGTTESLSAEIIEEILTLWLDKLNQGIEKAITYGNGLCPTYFAYDMVEYKEQEGIILPVRFNVINMPYFLEGPVRYLKMKQGKESAKEVFQKVKASQLYDQKLHMYKVNAPLENTSFEVGRAKAFTPGWLENESIWLHMEYKYLLEILRTGLYEEYFETLKQTLVPFLNPAVYGRSILENSSFIASSANPNQKIHGRGFVARLSGSTAEFLHMWQIMMIGETPFAVKNNTLTLNFMPAIPAYLIREDQTVTCKFLGDIEVTYYFTEKKDIIPGQSQVDQIELIYKDGGQVRSETSELSGQLAEDVREHRVSKVKVYMTA